MANTFFANPPMLTGTPADQVKQIQQYLYDVSQKLNKALVDIDIGQLSKDGQERIQRLQEKAEQSETNRTGLKELIIKNADISRTEEDEIRAQLTRNVTALTETLGELRQTLTSDIALTAQGIRQDYDLLESIVTTANGKNEEFRTRFSSFIYSGVIDPNTDPPTSGIAIGENVTNSDGTLNDSNKMAVFTAKRITFYNNNVPIGYYDGNTFHISKGEIDNTMIIGNFQFIKFADNSMGLMKI